ncbi:MAG: family 43 glycosylhydrolase [Oscillospiraceae bacterium]|nr:family 43 glycosylhydrolase [Oscillospiraceae bacterium]
MKQKRLLCAATALLCCTGMLAALPRSAEPITANAASTIANPFIWSDVPDDDIIRVGDTYYMVSTTMFFAPGAPIMKSKDLFSWEMCNYVYDTYADGAKQNLSGGEHDYAHGQWATSLRYHEGTFYVFFGSYGTGKSYIYKTTDIENGTWTRTELNGMYHDASMLFDEDGRKYLVYGSGEARIKEFNDDMTGFKAGGLDKVLFKTNLSGLAGEGSHIHKIGDYYYVFMIAWPNGHPRTEYCYRSKSLTGEWEGKVVLESGLGTYGSGVAQGGIVDTPDGKWYALLFQDHGAVGRVPVLVPFVWQNGWPVMGEGGKAPVQLTVPDGYKGTAMAKDDDFSYSADKLDLLWQWNHNPDNSAWSVTERDGWLRLKNKTTASELLHARNTLTMRTEGPACSSVVKLDASHMKAGDYAGLSAFQFKYGNVGVYVADDGSKKVYMAVNGGDKIETSSNKIVEQANMSGDEVYLKVEFNFNTVDGSYNVSNNIDRANFFYSFDGSNWTKIGSTLGMSYDLTLFTGYRSGLYSYATKSTGGYADFDYFDYERSEWNVPQVIEQDPDGYWFHYTFESGTEGFKSRGGESVTSSGAAHYAGSKAMLISDREASWQAASHTLSSAVFEPGARYSFSANAMYPAGADTDIFHLTFQYTGTDDEVHYLKIATENAVRGEWVQLANQSFQIPEDAAGDMYIYVETDTSTVDFYVDEMIGAPDGTAVKGAGKSNFVLGDVNSDGVINAVDLTLAKRGVLTEKFAGALAQKAADVDRNDAVRTADAVWIAKYVSGQTDAYPPQAERETPPPSDFIYPSALAYKEAPSKYFSQPANHGTVVKENYTGINGAKTMYVYLPYGYNENTKYNVFYLMHGGGEDENTCFNNPDIDIDLMLDNMIANGEIEPMIVVTPTFNKCPDGAGDVWDEMRRTIIPYVEGKYSTYAEGTSLDALKKSRYHRGYGGFSMGGGSTWNCFINNLDIMAYYMPLSGHCWGGAGAITQAIDKFGFKQNEYFVLAATGTEDVAYGNMVPLINDLKKDSRFIYTSDFSKGNLYFLEVQGNVHWWPQVRHYIYDALPLFFHEGQ